MTDSLIRKYSQEIADLQSILRILEENQKMQERIAILESQNEKLLKSSDLSQYPPFLRVLIVCAQSPHSLHAIMQKARLDQDKTMEICNELKKIGFLGGASGRFKTRPCVEISNSALQRFWGRSA
jgi:hypothetical protein